MEEKQIIRNKRQYNALEDKLSSQIKRIEELLKSGDIPWLRVKSAYSMCEIAIRQISQQIIDVYPLKQYIKLSQMILSELLQNINDDSEDDPTSQIQSRLMKPKSNRNKMLSSSNTIRDQSPYVSKRKIEIKSQRKIETVLGQSLVQNELKKVIQGLNNSKTTIIQQIINKKSKEKDNQQDFQKQLNGLVGDWKGELLQKHKQLNKWVQQNKLQHIQALKKKDIQIQKLIKQFESKKSQLHCGVQTSDLEEAAKDIAKQLKQKQIQYNNQKQRFIKITKGYQKEILELKKHNKSLRTSSHLKLQEYQKNILQMIGKTKYIKSQFKQYFEESRYIESIFFDVVEKHQKARTPFIPKNQIQQIYQKMKKNAKKQNLLYSILLDQQRVDSSKKTIKRQQSNIKTKKLASVYNEPLLNVLDIPSKLSKIRNSTRSNYSKNSSFSLPKDQTLPVIKVTEHAPSPRALGSHNSKSLYSDVRTILKQNQHYLSVINQTPKRQGHTPKMYSRKILNDNTRQNSIMNLTGKGSQLNIPSQNALKRESLRPIIKQLSKQNIASSQTLAIENKKQCLISSKNNITVEKKQQFENQQNEYVFDQNDEQEGEQEINYVININRIDQKQQQDMSKKRTSINIDQRALTKTVMNISNIDNIPIKHHHTQHFAPKATRTYYRKQTNIIPNKQKDSPKDIKKPIFQNKIQPVNILQKQINLFMQKYSSKLQYVQFQTQIAQSIQKVKQAHRSICTKAVCHHLKKFNDKVKKIKNQYYNRRPYKMAQLDIKHQK